MLNVLQTQITVQADGKLAWKTLVQLCDGHTSWDYNQERYKYLSMITAAYLEKVGK